MDQMPNHSTGGIEIGLRKSSDFGEPASTSTLDVTQLLYFFLLIPALFVAQMPLGIYPPLDTRLPMGLIIGTIPFVRSTPVDEHWQRRQAAMFNGGRCIYLRRSCSSAHRNHWSF